MDNHYHLLLELREGNLSRGAQWLSLGYSMWVNRRHGRLKELAREAGLTEYVGVAMAIKRYEALRDRDPVEQARFRHVVELLNVKM